MYAIMRAMEHAEVNGMEEVLRILLFAVVGGTIGFLTNKVAVKMLFRPHEVKHIGPLKIQGVLPKRKGLIAASLGEVIESAFLKKDDLFDAMLDDTTIERFQAELKAVVKEALLKKMPRSLHSLFGEGMSHAVDRFIDDESEAMIQKLFASVKEEGLERLDMSAMMKQNIDALDMETFEALALKVVKKELRFIELIGLILGIIIGLVQYGILWIV